MKYWENNRYDKVSFDFYKRVFHRGFRLKFLKPKKDECSVCTREMKSQLKIKTKSNESVITAAFDLEQKLLCTHGEDFYCSRRLKNHNLTIAQIDNMKTFAFLWNKNEAMKGTCEIATAVREFLLVKLNEGVKIIFVL